MLDLLCFVFGILANTGSSPVVQAKNILFPWVLSFRRKMKIKQAQKMLNHMLKEIQKEGRISISGETYGNKSFSVFINSRDPSAPSVIAHAKEIAFAHGYKLEESGLENGGRGPAAYLTFVLPEEEV